MYKEIEISSALRKLKRKIPYGWDLNIYRGCGYGCAYCYARYSHRFLGEKDFFGTIIVKKNIARILDTELSSTTWKREIINIGGVTDCYQPAEKKYGLMREILEVMLKHQNPVIISTKSDLILRDKDLIEKLSRRTYVNVAASVTTMDERLRKKWEPGSSPTLNRFRVLKEFARTNASRGLHLMPILPYLSDSEENIERILKSAKDAGVSYVLSGTLYLRRRNTKIFF